MKFQNQMIEQQVIQAVEVLKRGGVILYPTDTVWGVGCDATNSAAVEKVVRLKHAEGKIGHIVLMESADMAVRYVNKAPGVAWELMELADKPLTLILPGGCGIAPELLGADGSIALRVPDHEFCRQLLRRLRRPIMSTSANLTGEPTPLRYEEIAKEIIAGVDFAVDEACEGKPTRKPSAMIQLGEGGEIKIIR